jgi:hypothetical protein
MAFGNAAYRIYDFCILNDLPNSHGSCGNHLYNPSCVRKETLILEQANAYAYVNGNPISRRDPLGLWSLSGMIYAGPGGEVTIGSDNGRFFLTARFGLGLGAGYAYDPDGKIPGPDVSDSCRGGIVLAATAKGDFRSGPADFGYELGAARNYTLQQSGIVNEFTGQAQAPWQGLEGGFSFGGQITLYKSKKCGCDASP